MAKLCFVSEIFQVLRWRPFDKAETINCGQSKEGIVIEAKTICKLKCEGKRKIIVLEGS
jgi:hypothetical protein